MSAHLIKSCRLNIYIAGIIRENVSAAVRDLVLGDCSEWRGPNRHGNEAKRLPYVRTCDLDKTDKDNPTGGLKRGERGRKKAAATHERSGELSMHCVIARVYPLYYAHLPSLSTIPSRTIFNGRDFLPDGSSLLPSRYL